MTIDDIKNYAWEGQKLRFLIRETRNRLRNQPLRTKTIDELTQKCDRSRAAEAAGC